MEIETNSEYFEDLINQILYKGTGYGKFKVFDYEASSGKTLTYSKAVVDYYHQAVDFIDTEERFEFGHKSLIVIKTMNEGFAVQKIINDYDNSLENVNKDYEQFALAINTDYKNEHPELRKMTEREYINFLRKYPALIITQAEYLKICNNPQRGNDFYGERETLIIDEEVDIVNDTFETLSMNDITKIEEEYLSGCYTCQSIFQEIVQKLKPILATCCTQMERKIIDMDVASLNSLVQRFHYYLLSSIDDQKLTELRKFPEICKTNDSKETVINNILQKVKSIEQFYNNQDVIHYQYYLHRYNSQINLFTLKNNIWIDASASFNYIYKLKPDKFDTSFQSERIIDHSGSIVNFDILTKSTTSGKKKRYVDLERDVLNYILANNNEKDKTLIIDNETFCSHINDLIEQENFKTLKCLKEEKRLDITNFQKMRGSNNWKDFNKVFIIQQPQFLLPYYVFLYEYWSGNRLTNIEMHLGNHIDDESGESIYGFYLPNTVNGTEVIYTEEQQKHSYELECVRYSSQASSIYQGMKRIQRNQHPIAEYNVLLNDKRMREVIVKQFKGIKVDYININPETKLYTAETIVNKFRKMIYEFDENTMHDIKNIAFELETQKDYVKTMIRRNEDIATVLKAKNIKIVDLMEASWFLLNAESGSILSITKFEHDFQLNWENYRRSKDARKVKSLRNIKTKDGNIIIPA